MVHRIRYWNLHFLLCPYAHLPHPLSTYYAEEAAEYDTNLFQ